MSSIPGLVARHPNSNVHALKGPLWCRLHAALGEGGDRIMMDMLMDCAIFRLVSDEFANYYQLSGPHISDLEPRQVPTPVTSRCLLADAAAGQRSDKGIDERTPCKIAFVRSRMLYAKAALNAKGGIRFGMRHIRWCTIDSVIATSTNVGNRRAEPLSLSRQ